MKSILEVPEMSVHSIPIADICMDRLIHYSAFSAAKAI